MSNLGTIGEDHERCEELGMAASKNLSGYGERHVRKVVNGTGETLLITHKHKSKADAYKRK